MMKCWESPLYLLLITYMLEVSAAAGAAICVLGTVAALPPSCLYKFSCWRCHMQVQDWRVSRRARIWPFLLRKEGTCALPRNVDRLSSLPMGSSPTSLSMTQFSCADTPCSYCACSKHMLSEQRKERKRIKGRQKRILFSEVSELYLANGLCLLLSPLWCNQKRGSVVFFNCLTLYLILHLRAFFFFVLYLQSSFLGSATFSVGDLLRAKDERLTLSLR